MRATTTKSDEARPAKAAGRAPADLSTQLQDRLGNRAVARSLGAQTGSPRGWRLEDRIGNRATLQLLSSLRGSPERRHSEREAEAVAEGAGQVTPASAPIAGEATVGEAVRALPGGEPIRPTVLASTSAQLGVDLSAARVHSGPEASALVSSLQSRAFTFGDRVVLGPGAGAHTLRHELAHVAQQTRSGVAVLQRDGEDILPPDTVVVVNAPHAPVPDEPLAAWPGLAAALDENQYAGLRNALRARQLQVQIDTLLRTRTSDPHGEVARLQAEQRTAAQAAVSSVQVPMRILLSTQVTPVETAGLRAAILPLLQQRAPAPIIGLGIRNEILARYLAREFPEPSNVTVTLQHGGRDLTFTLADHVVTADRGYIGIEALRQAKGAELDRIQGEVTAEAVAMAQVVDALLNGRDEVARLPGLTQSISTSPADYALLEVRDIAARAHQLAGRLGTASTSPTAGEMASELTSLQTQLNTAAATLDGLVRTAEGLHARTQERSLIEQHFDALDTAQRLRREGSWFSALGWYQISGDLSPMSGAGPYMAQQHEAVLTYRLGRISLNAYRSLQSSIATRELIGAAVGLALSFVGGWLGAAGGRALFGATSVGVELMGGFGGGAFGAVGALGSQDIYSSTAAAFSNQPAVSQYLRATMHTPGEYAGGVLLGGGLGMLGGLAMRQPRIPGQPPVAPVTLYRPDGTAVRVLGGQVLPEPQAPVRLFTGSGEPITMSGGQVVPEPQAPVRLFSGSGEPIMMQGGQVVPPPASQGPVVLLQGSVENPRPLIIQGGREWVNPRAQIGFGRPPQYAPSAFGPPIIRGESRLLTAGGESVTGIVQPPLPDVLTATGEVAPRTGPTIVDLQSGTGMWLRDVVARTPGSTGIGVESGNWMLAYRGIYPATEAEFAAEIARVRTGGLIPADPAWATPGVRRPPLLPWERNPSPYFFPESGPVRVLPEPFFPAFGEGGGLPRNPQAAAGVRPTSHPELWGQADQVYLRRPFALSRADTVQLGQELNRMLRPGAFVEVRPSGPTDFSAQQLPVLTEQIPGARVVRVDRPTIRAFQRTGQMPANLTAEQQAMVRSAAADTSGLGPGDFTFVARIYKQQ